MFRSGLMTLVLRDIALERERQEQLKAEGRFRNTPDEVDLSISYLMLAEELGEVGRAILAVTRRVQETTTVEDLRTELIHVAAIAVAMVEGIDHESN